MSYLIGSNTWGVCNSKEDSDYDSDTDAGYVSDSSEEDGGGFTIYPGPDSEHYRYRHAHLRDFSQKAINQYNHQTGSRYEFVELVRGSVNTTVEYAYIEVTFKACQSDATGVTPSFKATTYSTAKSLTGSYEIESVKLI